MQWLLYGNHPSPVAFTGMTIVLVAGLYGVVSGTIFNSVIAECRQIYGPADTLKSRPVGHLNAERTPLLRDDEE
jgi:hypothetical protein